MTMYICNDEFANLIASQSDRVIDNALRYGGDRVFFVEDCPVDDFDMLHYGKIIVKIFVDKQALMQALNNEVEVKDSIESTNFESNHARVTEAMAFVSSRPKSDLRKWLRVCLQRASNVPMEDGPKFDLLFFCKTMEQFFWDGMVVQALLKGDPVGQGFHLD